MLLVTLLLLSALSCQGLLRTDALNHLVAARNSRDSKPREITSLPGFRGDLPSKQFSGYITVDEDHGRHLFYWVVHSERSLRRDPVILWLTGGPGCSSMDALIYEHGPFQFSFVGDGAAANQQEILLKENPYSWSKAATVIYVDSPAGAGLSYSETKSDYTTDDTKTVDDLYTFLQQLWTLMPELSSQDLYLAGESYGGVFVPMLAKKILDMRKQAGSGVDVKLKPINLKGYMVGNAVTDDIFEGNGKVEFAYGMGLIDPETYSGLEDICAGSYWNATQGGACSRKLKKAFDVFYWVNPYDILKDCHVSNARLPAQQSMTPSAVSRRLLQGHGHAHSAHGMGQGADAGTELDSSSTWLRAWDRRLQHTVPCGDRSVALAWLAKPEVRRAIHAATVHELPWQPCSDILDYTVPEPISLISLHKELVMAGLRALVYSGDHDLVVPFTGTRRWVYSMGLEQERPYSAWMMNQQVAGFIVKFVPGLTFATVKGAGHMVPQSNPREALMLISRFLKDEL